MRKPTAIALAVLVAASAGLYGLGPQLAGASSHREAPMIAFGLALFLGWWVRSRRRPQATEL